MFLGETLDALALTARYAGSTFVLYYLLVFSYRLLFHPLRSYPGPLLAKITDGYGGLHALSRNLHITTYRDHLKHGSVFRAGPNRLVFNTTTALQKIYNNDRLTKSHVYLLTLQANGVDSIFNCVDRDRHRSKRRLISKVVSDRSIRLFEPSMKDQIHIFLQLLLASSQEPSLTEVNMSERCKRLGLDIIGLLAFGFPLNTQTEEQYRLLSRAWPLGRSDYLAALERMISTRLAMDKHAKVDFYSFIAEHIETGGPDSIRLTELWAEAVFFFPAGGDTTATAMSALFFYLSRNPEAYHKLAKEVRSTFADADESRVDQNSRDAAIFAPPLTKLYVYLPPWEALYDGHIIPPGTQLGVNIYSLHHNEDYFPDSFAFKPERWLIEDSATLRKMHTAFDAFSTGSRGCAGKSMAYLEASMVIAKTFWYFDFETAPGLAGTAGGGKRGNGAGREREGEFQLYDGFTSSHDGPNLIFHTRGDYWKDLS